MNNLLNTIQNPFDSLPPHCHTSSPCCSLLYTLPTKQQCVFLHQSVKKGGTLTEQKQLIMVSSQFLVREKKGQMDKQPKHGWQLVVLTYKTLGPILRTKFNIPKDMFSLSDVNQAGH